MRILRIGAASEQNTIHQRDPPPVLQANTPVTLDWQPSWMFEFGVTRYFDKGWHVSAGYVYSQNAVPDAYYTPLAADLDRQFFSLAPGIKANGLISTSPTNLAMARRTQ